MNNRRPFCVLATALALCAATVTTAAAQAPDAAKPVPVEVTIYPILVVAPIFGASIDLPSIPSRPPGENGGEAGAQTGSTDISLNAAYMAGMTVRGDRWMGLFRGQWAALSANRQSPRFNVDTDAYFFNAKGGVRLVDGFWVTGGFRRIGLTVDATLTLPIVDRSVSGSTKKAFWDPIVGVEWRRRMGRFAIDTMFDGGGFGVGTDADVSGEANLDIRVLKHVDLRLGYSYFYYKLTVADVSIGSYQRTLVSSQTLHGPIAGIGIVF